MLLLFGVLRRQGRWVGVMGLAVTLMLTACGAEQAPPPPKAETAASSEPAAAAGGATAAPQGPELDPISGLIIDEGWEMVRGTCAACHSASLVTQNRGSRETWLEMIRWMQESQGLWPLDPAMEATILDYLARNYPPAASSRRAPLSPELMPNNPYDDKGPG